LRYRHKIRWGVILAGLLMGGVGIGMAFQERIFLRNLGADPGDSVLPLALKMSFASFTTWAVVALGIAFWAFFGLKKWANKTP